MATSTRVPRGEGREGLEPPDIEVHLVPSKTLPGGAGKIALAREGSREHEPNAREKTTSCQGAHRPKEVSRGSLVLPIAPGRGVYSTAPGRFLGMAR